MNQRPSSALEDIVSALTVRSERQAMVNSSKKEHSQVKKVGMCCFSEVCVSGEGTFSRDTNDMGEPCDTTQRIVSERSNFQAEEGPVQKPPLAMEPP